MACYQEIKKKNRHGEQRELNVWSNQECRFLETFKITVKNVVQVFI